MKSGLIYSLLIALATIANPVSALVLQYFPAASQFDFVGFGATCLAQGFALSWWSSHSSLHGLRLGFRVSAVLILIFPVLAQIETLMYLSVWNHKLTSAQVGTLVLQHLVFDIFVGAFIWAMNRKPKKFESKLKVKVHARFNLVLRVGFLAIMYFVIYWLAGYFIAIPIAGEAFQQLYGGLQIPVWMPVFQVARGLGFVWVAVLILRDFVGTPWKAYFTVGLVMASVLGAGLLMRNPIFPDAVRYAHLVEIFVSMMLFGGLCGFVLVKRKPTS